MRIVVGTKQASPEAVCDNAQQRRANAGERLLEALSEIATTAARASDDD
jgi:hypothetical protein